VQGHRAGRARLKTMVAQRLFGIAPGYWRAPEEVLVQGFAAQPYDQALDRAICIGSRGAMWCQATSCPACQPRMACAVGSVPLRLTIIQRRPRRWAIRSSSRATRLPESELSATKVGHSLLKSSTTTSTWERRPSLKTSESKSRLQRLFSACKDRHRGLRA
jgi:hypothetical protein